MTRTRFMAALVIVDAAEQILLPSMGEDAPEMIWDPTAALMKRIETGEKADGIFAIKSSMDVLEERGLIVPESRKPIVQAEFGIAVALDLDVKQPENAAEFVALLRKTPRIVYSRAGASGIYFEKLIDRLGIGDEIRAKSLVIAAGLTGKKVRDGEGALAIQQMSELKAVDGIRILGPLPDDCQQVTDFDAAVFATAENPGGASRFVELLQSPLAAESFVARGLRLRY